MRNARADGLLDQILNETIPMHGRMIHGRHRDGHLYQESQTYDVHGRVCVAHSRFGCPLD